MRFLSPFIAVLCLALTSMAASVFADEMHLYCKEPSILGLFEQCQEIVILEKTSHRFRAYSKPQKLVLSLEPRFIFVARTLKAKEKISAGDSISIGGNLLWNASRLGFQSLCRVSDKASKSTASKNPTVNVACGRNQTDRIHRDMIYKVSPYSATDKNKRQPRI